MDIEKLIQDLIDKKEIDTLRSKFSNNVEKVENSLKEYRVATHEVMKRSDKILKDGTEVTNWSLPIAYQQKIVQSAVAFLFAKPVSVKQESKETDNEFQRLIDLMNDIRTASKDQENAKHMFSEIESAKLFVPYRDPKITDEEELSKTGVVGVKCILLAKSLGDTLHTLFDSYGVLKAFGREYVVTLDKKDVTHFDIFTNDIIYYCNKKDDEWEIKKVENLIKKIPVVYYMHPDKKSEWSDVQKLIERREWLTSTRADNNDRTGDPILLLEGEVIKLPEAKQVGKVVQLGVGSKASYLVPQMSVDMVKDEKEDLKELIHYLTSTPDLSMDKMSSLGLTSGKAIEMAFFDALLKAMSRHGFFQEMKEREINILKAYLTEVIYQSEYAKDGNKMKNLKTSIEFGNPLPDNTEDLINIISTATGGKSIMSQKRGIELNPMVNDTDAELVQINSESVSENPDDI